MTTMTTPSLMIPARDYFAVIKHARNWYHAARVVCLKDGSLFEVGPWETHGSVTRKEAMGRAREAANRTRGAMLSGIYVRPPGTPISSPIVPESNNG